MSIERTYRNNNNNNKDILRKVQTENVQMRHNI